MIQTSSDNLKMESQCRTLATAICCYRKGMLDLGGYDDLCFSFYLVSCHHCQLKGTDSHPIPLGEAPPLGLTSSVLHHGFHCTRI
jgi:hypothetical protein